MKLVFTNNKKTMENINLISDCKDEYEKSGYLHYIACLSYSVYNKDGSLYTVSNGGHGYWKWEVCCGSESFEPKSFHKKQDALDWIIIKENTTNHKLIKNELESIMVAKVNDYSDTDKVLIRHIAFDKEYSNLHTLDSQSTLTLTKDDARELGLALLELSK